MSTEEMADIRLQTAGEGRYLKAYLAFLAGWRDFPPSLVHYNLSDRPERARLIRGYAHDLVKQMRRRPRG
jgi:hypothetical protein